MAPWLRELTAPTEHQSSNIHNYSNSMRSIPLTSMEPIRKCTPSFLFLSPILFLSLTYTQSVLD